MRQFANRDDIKAANKKAYEARAKATQKAGYPIPPTVERLFGSWTTDLKAAGLKPRRQGGTKAAAKK